MMSAQVVRTGFSTTGYNEQGVLQQVNLALLLAEIPGENGEWMFVVEGTDFCWLHAEANVPGCGIIRHPLHGEQWTWNDQITAYVGAGVPQGKPTERLAPGVDLTLYPDDVHLMVE